MELWLKHGWYIAVAYIVGFFVMLAILAGIPILQFANPDVR